MNIRNLRGTPLRAHVAPLHRGPQAAAHAAAGVAAPHGAPNAALLIDFDNVTMGIRSDLQTELRNLLSSDIISGKVAVQRAYADWRRYPQYIVPLSESSIDLIFAPAYGSAKKNATDIRLAIDALELVFTRPEIGTFILLSGDSDFSSLVIKLKEYGKYVIGVGIRESSSDLLVQNCDEYYSYNALAGLVKANDQDPAQKWDPWELVKEAVGRMKKNGDVMRSDRLKQVMQEIDASFDEKDLGMSKFSRFVQEAANRGLLSIAKLENGQLEIDLPAGVVPAEPRGARPEAAAAPAAEAGVEESRPRRGRRGRGGRGRDREDRPGRPEQPADAARQTDATGTASASSMPAVAPSVPAAPRSASPNTGSDTIGLSGERLTRQEAFDLVRKTVAALLEHSARPLASTTRWPYLSRLSDVRRPRAARGDRDDLRGRVRDHPVRGVHAADATPQHRPPPPERLQLRDAHRAARQGRPPREDRFPAGRSPTLQSKGVRGLRLPGRTVKTSTCRDPFRRTTHRSPA